MHILQHHAQCHSSAMPKSPNYVHHPPWILLQQPPFLAAVRHITVGWAWQPRHIKISSTIDCAILLVSDTPCHRRKRNSTKVKIPL